MLRDEIAVAINQSMQSKKGTEKRAFDDRPGLGESRFRFWSTG